MSPRKISTMILASALAAYAFVLLFANWPVSRVTAQRQAPGSVDPQVAALKRLQAASRTPIRVSFAGGFPRSVTARVQTQGSDAVDRAEFFLSQYRDLYAQQSAHLKLNVRTVNRPPVENVLYYQTYRGIEVFAAGLLVSLDRHEVFHTAGALVTSDIRLDHAPKIHEEQAESIVRRQLERAGARLGAPTTLMVYDRSLLDSKSTPNPRLAWRVTLEEGEIKQVLVDAHDGQVLLMLPSAYDGGAPLHGLSLNIQDAFDLFQSEDSGCYSFGTELVAAEGQISFFNSSYNSDPDAVQGLAHLKGIYSFFHENFNRHSYDDDFSQLELFIHSTTGGTARWNPSCQLMEIQTGKVDFDILTHEFTHAVIGDTSQLVYVSQSGALNESYADIMAAIADQEREEALGKPTDWLLGEGKTDGTMAIRDLSDPPSGSQPDHMNGFFSPAPCPPGLDFEFAKCNDYGGVHTNSGIPNKTAFLMAAGGTHPVSTLIVEGMGRDKTRNLKWIAATHLLYFADFALAAGYELAWLRSGPRTTRMASLQPMPAQSRMPGPPSGLASPIQTATASRIPPTRTPMGISLRTVSITASQSKTPRRRTTTTITRATPATRMMTTTACRTQRIIARQFLTRQIPVAHSLIATTSTTTRFLTM